MTLNPLMTFAAAAVGSLLAVMPFDPALAGGSSHFGTMSSGPNCKTGGGSTVIINKPVNINKPVTIYNPVTINKSINVYNPVTISKNIDIQNNVTVNKSVNIEKNITINNGGGASAIATATAMAQAFASAQAGGIVAASTGPIYYGSYYEENVIYKGVGGDLGSISAGQACEMQEATVIKAIYAVCVASDGREFPASHMTPATFIDTSYEGEIARCIPGARLKLVIGDVVQSDSGMAGTYAHGATLLCGEHEAVRHYKDGMLKCEQAVPVKDCTERTNLRKYGTGDMFFSYRSQVCATPARAAGAHPVEVTGMTLEGGVGDPH